MQLARAFAVILLVAGVLVTAAGLLTIDSVWQGSWPSSVQSVQSDCEGGDSPVPNQGCGYVPYLVLYVWGENSVVVQSIEVAEIGSVLLLIGLSVSIIFRAFGFRSLLIISLFVIGLARLAAYVSISSLSSMSQIYNQFHGEIEASEQVLGELL